MDSLYQLRKDIDKLYSKFFDVESGEWDISSKEELDEILERLNADNSLDILEANLNTFSKDLDGYVDSLESFESQLDGYGDSLDGFSGQLSDYGDTLDGFSGQLSDYGDTLDGFSGQLSDYSDSLDGFEDDLGDYGTQLNALDDALNNQSSGFIVTLSALKTYIYGYDPQNPNAHTYNNPTSDSLKGMTNALQQLIVDLQTGDGIVLENLGRLKSHIQAFNGSLQQFKTYLAQQGVDVSTLNDDVISLILELNKSLDTISEHSDMLVEAQEIIGEPSSGGEPATGIFKRLEDGEDVMDAVSTQADALDVIINGDPQVTGDTGLVGATSSLQTTVGNSSSGLVKDTNALKTTVGNSSSGLVKDTNSLKTTVGNSSSGLVKQTNDLSSTVGDSSSGLIKQTNDIITEIGEPSSSGQSATGLHLAIENAQDTADAVDGAVTLVKNKIGYSSIGNTNLQTQINTHDNKIGTVDVVRDGNLQTQIHSTNSRIDDIIWNNRDNQIIWVINEATPSSQDWRILFEDYGVILNNIHYAYNPSRDLMWVRDDDVWETIDYEEIMDNVEFICGVSYDVRTVSTVTSAEEWDYIYSCLFDCFYEKSNGSWVVSQTNYLYGKLGIFSIIDTCPHAHIGSTVGDSQWKINDLINNQLGILQYDRNRNVWESSTLNSYTTLHINKTLKMCSLKYYRTGYNFTSTSEVTLHSGIIPSDYRPSYSNIGSSYNPRIGCAVNSSGDILVNSMETGSKTLNLTIWWIY